MVNPTSIDLQVQLGPLRLRNPIMVASGTFGYAREMAGLVDDDILNAIAVVGTPEEIAAKIAKRFAGKADRISPVAYAPEVKLLGTLCREIRAVI